MYLEGIRLRVSPGILRGYHPDMRCAPEKVKVEVAEGSFSQVKHVDMFWRENHPAAVEKSEYFFEKIF